MHLLLEIKITQENTASSINNKLAKAIEKSNRIIAEDIIRESGFMFPQSGNTKEFSEALLQKNTDKDLLVDDIKDLLSKLKFNEINIKPI